MTNRTFKASLMDCICLSGDRLNKYYNLISLRLDFYTNDELVFVVEVNG